MSFETRLILAISLSEDSHEGQLYGNVPYVFHTFHVQQVLYRFGYNPFGAGTPEHIKLSEDLSIASLLHDVVEDTDVTLKQIKKRFGKRIASLVNGVTNEDGINRKERHRKTYPKIKRIPGAIILKLADRIANIETCIATGDGRINMYRKEHNLFEKELRDGTSNDRMWNYIRKLLS